MSQGIIIQCRRCPATTLGTPPISGSVLNLEGLETSAISENFVSDFGVVEVLRDVECLVELDVEDTRFERNVICVACEL
jgi:hypothetical protein